jgi:O-antigen ligase
LICLTPLIWALLKTRRNILLGAIVTAGLALVAVHVIAPEATAYLGLGLDLLGRDAIWREVFHVLPSHLWLGYGLLNIGFLGYTAHNIYLTQLAYFGVLGFTAFMLVLGLWARKVAAGRPFALDQQLLIAIAVGALVHGMFEYFITCPLMFTNSFFWLMTGAIIALERREA